MKNIPQFLAIGFALLLTAGNAFAVDTRVKVVDAGMNEGEGERRYNIYCSSGAKTFVSHYFVKGEVCYYPIKKPEMQCMPGNDVDAAAVNACNE